MNNYRPFLALRLKSIYRTLLSKQEQGLFIIYAILGGCILYFMWMISEGIFRITGSFPASSASNFIYIRLWYGIFCGDFMLKLLFRNHTQPHPLLQCLPGYKSVTTNWYYLTQCLSFWNLYPFVLLFHFIGYYLFPVFGVGSTLLFCMGIYLIGLLNNCLVGYLKISKRKMITGVGCFIMSSATVYLFNMATLSMQHRLLILMIILLIAGNFILLKVNYTTLRYFENSDQRKRKQSNRVYLTSSNPYIILTWLYLKMIIRSPRLKQQLITLSILIGMYLYMIISGKNIMENFISRLVFYPFILAIIPLTLNQYLFSGEGGFFSRLLTLTTFPRFLKARYLSFLAVITVIYILLLLITRNNLFELTALYLFCAGPVTLSSFLNIFFVSHKQDLSTLSKNWSEAPQGHYLLSLILMVVLFLPIVLLNIFFSPVVAICYMCITGLLSLVYARKYLEKLYQIYIKSAKYKQLENFRD